MSSSRGVDENSVDPTRHLEIHHWRVENEDVTSEFFFVHRLLVMKDLDVRTSFFFLRQTAFSILVCMIPSISIVSPNKDAFSFSTLIDACGHEWQMALRTLGVQMPNLVSFCRWKQMGTSQGNKWKGLAVKNENFPVAPNFSWTDVSPLKKKCQDSQDGDGTWYFRIAIQLYTFLGGKTY